VAGGYLPWALPHAIDVPVEALPAIDEHAVVVRASVEDTWDAIVATLPRSLGGGLAERYARAVGCEQTAAQGDPATIGSTLPGFIVARSIRPAMLTLLGEHRFSRYALVFKVDRLDDDRSLLRAETRADFPGARGRIYRALVIGTRGHIVAVTRILRAIRRRAEHG
jgi:hypothetical protein